MPIVYNEVVKKPYHMLDGPQLTLQEVPWHSLMLTPQLCDQRNAHYLL